MFPKRRLKKKNDRSSADTPAPLDSGPQMGASATNERELLVDSQASREIIVTSNARSPVEINGQGYTHSVVLLAYGEPEHVVGGGSDGKIRQWRAKDGKEVGRPMDHGSVVRSLAVSQDSQWIVSGTNSGHVTVWDAMNHEKVIGFRAHDKEVYAVDFSPDSTRIASGSVDRTFCVWSFPTGEQLLGPFIHDFLVVAVKFTPDGRLIATATYCHNSVRIYDSSDGHLIADFPVRVDSTFNGALAWAKDSKRLFASSHGGDIHCLDVSTRETLAKWRIHNKGLTCIALACNDRFIAASANSSLSFWDTTTHQQIGTIINHSHLIWSIAISPSYSIATAGHKAITLRNLCDILPAPYWDDMGTRTRARPRPYRLDTVQPSSSSTHLNETIQELRCALATSQQTNNQLTETIRLLRADLDAQEARTDDREQTVQELRVQVKKYECETLFAHGRIYDAVQYLFEIGVAKQNKTITDWLEEFTIRCISELQMIGDEASRAENHDEALSAYSAILLLTPSPPEGVLTGWVRMALVRCSATEALSAANKFKLTEFHVYRAICKVLEDDDRVAEVIESLRNMKVNISQETSAANERSRWKEDFRQHCIVKMEKGGDVAMDSKNHDAAIGSYSSALSLDPTNISIIVKCCKSRKVLLEDELANATVVTERDPSNYKGYERKHAVLHSMGRPKEAFEAFEIMLSRIETSPDPQIRELRSRYLDTTPLVQGVVERTVRDIPRVLIDTTTGYLYDKAQQAAAFEELPIFNELRSSMTTRDRFDHLRIEREVERFYKYVMFSHRWQPSEPTFQMVENISIYELPASPTNDKLVRFSRLVRSRHFRWAWSDTCCVNQADKGVQQESVVAMFRWYCRAALTIVHLLGVHSGSQKKGSLWKSIWNTRGWTYQEYVASEVIQFYTEDWKPYLDLEMFNHKESPIILEEMEQATNFATLALATLQPGLTRVREKLYLASKRQTTREEDIAYSLFGIFNVTIPVIYGEGNQAAGRLLEHVLTRSDNVMILAWTGNAGSNHSYLPFDLTVYDQVVPPHAPQPIEIADMDRMVIELQSSLPDSSLIGQLYKQLHDLPSLSIISGRLRLPGLVFRLTDLVHLPAPESDPGLHVYRTTTPLLGEVRIETKDDSLATQRLVLVHPWINPLIDEDFEGDAPLLDLLARALRLVVRLRQPFGALLLASQGRMQYTRIATDSFIKVQIREETSLEEMMESIRTVDVQ